MLLYITTWLIMGGLTFQLDSETPSLHVNSETAFLKIGSKTASLKFDVETASPKVDGETASMKVDSETASPKVGSETASPKVGSETASQMADCRFWGEKMEVRGGRGPVHSFYWWDEAVEQCKACTRCLHTERPCSRSYTNIIFSLFYSRYN